LRGIGAEVDVTIRNVVGLLNASEQDRNGMEERPTPTQENANLSANSFALITS